jgi:hypothetical protein
VGCKQGATATEDRFVERIFAPFEPIASMHARPAAERACAISVWRGAV